MKQGSGDDPFTDEGDTSEDGDENSEQTELKADGAATESLPGSAPGRASEPTSASEGIDRVDANIDLSEPAFEYEADMQERVYVLNEVYEEYERTRKFKINLKLDEHGVSNPKGREIGTALIETAEHHWPEIVQRVLARRGLSVDLDDL